MNQTIKIILIFCLIILFAYYLSDSFGDKSSNKTDNWRFNKNIIFSKHAKCRMSCRQIDSSEVNDILKNGTLNKSKTNHSSQGVSYALEGRTTDGQQVRLVVAPKSNKLIIVTVIDLNREWPCVCD